MKQDITTARKIAEARLDRVMAGINPNIGFTFGIDNTAYLCDIPRKRLILDREPNEREKAALMAYTVELQLRCSDGLVFEHDDKLYCHEFGGDYVRWRFNPDTIKWESEKLSLESWILIHNYVEAHTVSESDRAAKAADDMKRLAGEMQNKPFGKIEE